MRSSLVLFVGALGLLVAAIAVVVFWKSLALLATGWVCWRAMRRQRRRAGL